MSCDTVWNHVSELLVLLFYNEMWVILKEFGMKFSCNLKHILEASHWFPSCGRFLWMEMSITELLLLSVKFQNKLSLWCIKASACNRLYVYIVCDWLDLTENFFLGQILKGKFSVQIPLDWYLLPSWTVSSRWVSVIVCVWTHAT